MIQADTEIEGVNMALGAAATGARAATGSTGQGVALMQEAIAEAALNELPLVIFTMGRGQQDYFQCTRGGGWGDYRTITLAPSSVVEADELTRLAFELADKWLTPVIVYGDHMIGFTQMTVEHDPARAPAPHPDKPWALDGSSGGTGQSKVIWTWRMGKHNTPGVGPDQHWRDVAAKYDEVARVEPRHTSCVRSTDARHLVVSFGTTGSFVDYVVDDLRTEGHAIGTFRPVTLWPFPSDALAAAAADCEQVLVYELNAGPDGRRRSAGGERRGARPLDRRREPRRVGHAPGRVARRRHHAREDSRGNRRSRSMTEGTPVDLTGARKVAPFAPDLLQTTDHYLCSGCGHPVAWRLLVEVLDELNLVDRSIGVVGHGCYTQIITTADVEFLQCLHGRAPAVATGMKRMLPDRAIYTLQGDGDMVSEGLAEVLHIAARGESITCIVLDNGVFGDTGGQMTATTSVGQRTKTDVSGRAPAQYGYPIPIADIVAQLPGVAYVARGAVDRPNAVSRTRRYLREAFESQLAGEGFSLVEILTMCPTGWSVPADKGAEYQRDERIATTPLGELRAR